MTVKTEQTFDVGVQEIIVPLKAKQGEAMVRLVHVLRPASSSELKEYNRLQSETEIKRRKVKFKGSSLDAAEYLWNKTIRRIEGYSFNGKPLMEEENWQAMVPLMHKETAIREAFGEVYAESDEDDDQEGEREL